MATIDTTAVAKLRADVLLLLRNAERVKNYAQLVQFADAVNTFRTYFKGFVADVSKGLDQARQETWAKRVRSDTWDLVITLSVPFERHGSKYAPTASPEEHFLDYQSKAKAWAEKVKRAARKAWKILDDLLTVQGSQTYFQRQDEQLTIEGFTVILRNLGARNAARDRDSLEGFKAALSVYKRRAQRVMPDLLKRKLPLVLVFDCGLDEGGVYKGDHILVCSSVKQRDLAHVLAHEMGHHLWRVSLGADAQEFWTSAVRADYGPLDLEALLAVWPEGESDLWFFDNDELARKDPTLYLQVNAVLFPPLRHEKPPFSTRDELAVLVRQGTETVPVPLNPITAYATKNPEEAFCEALGMLVGYGPQAVPALVRRWLQIILPSLRLEVRSPFKALVAETARLLAHTLPESRRDARC